MARHTKSASAVVVLVAALAASASTRAHRQALAEPSGVSGYVLAPDGMPVAGGAVLMLTPPWGTRATAAIARNGRFRLAASASGLHQLLITVPGLSPYRVNVTVPPSRTLTLPVIHLQAASYFRVRFVSTDGEPITAPRFIHRSVDVTGMPVSDPPDDRVPHEIDSEGTITLGPLPRGITMLALDTPPLAQTRLPDLLVTGADTPLDAGVVTVGPGATLLVDVADRMGAPVPAHEVFLEDPPPLSPLPQRAARTDRQGRATFDRLAEGRYRVRARLLERCGSQVLSAAQLVSVPGSGVARTRLVLGGGATFRVSSPLGPVRGAAVSATPEQSASPPPAWLRASEGSPFLRRPLGPFGSVPSCGGTTDADGLVTLRGFPRGPARIDVRQLNSLFVQRVAVPIKPREVPVVIPDGFLPVRVTHAVTRQPVAGASVVWSGGGSRVEATTSAIGEALLEGVGATGGTLAITARGLQRTEMKLAEPPALLYEMALVPAPPTSLQPRVIRASGEPLPGAVVELLSENPLEVAHVAVTDARGDVSFTDVPPGALRLIARADSFVPAAIQIAEDARGRIVLTLARGYRVIASVDLPPESGPHLVRVVNESGVSMDGVLGAASHRSVEPPARVSLGPLPPGTYVLDIRGAQHQWQERVRIVDRDVYANVRSEPRR